MHRPTNIPAKEIPSGTAPAGGGWIAGGACLLLFSLAGLYLRRLSHAPPYVNDELYYFALAKYLLAGYGYVDACFVGSPAHNVWPILEPLFTAGAIRIFGENYFLLRALHLFAGFAALIPVYFLFKRICGRWKALSVVLLTAASCGVLFPVALVRADLPYFLFSFSFLLWAEKLRRGNPCSISNLITGAILLALSCLFRQIGFTLLLILPALLLLRMPENRDCRKRTWLFMVFSVLAAAAYMFALKAGSEYAVYFRSSIQGGALSFPEMLLGIMKSVYAALFYGFPSVLTGYIFEERNYIALFISALVLAGFVRSLLRERTALDFYFLIYMTVLMLYPASGQVVIRYLIPLAPTAFYYLVSALEVPAGLISRRPLALITTLLLAAELAVTVAAPPTRAGAFSSSQSEGTKLMADWVRKNTPENAIFLSNNPQALHIYAGRKSVKSSILFPTPELREPGTALAWLRNNAVDYIVTDGFWERTQLEFYPAMTACTACFRMVYSGSGFSVYKADLAVASKGRGLIPRSAARQEFVSRTGINAF